MITIYKYELKFKLGSEESIIQPIQMPERSKILCVKQMDDLSFYIWAIVNTNNVMCSRKIILVGTGWPDEESNLCFPYIGTVIIKDDNFVWHFFDGGYI